MDKSFSKRKGNSYDLKLIKWVVNRLEWKCEDLDKQYFQAARLRRQLSNKCRIWNKRKHFLLLESYKRHEETINALRNAMCTNAGDLCFLRGVYTAKLKKISKKCTIKISSNEWWNIVIYLTQCQDLMDKALEVFHEAYLQFKALQAKVSQTSENRTHSTIRYFINS
ncbi:hypothetical protein AVEN_96304-1 [Araneus ventricosus]|uniref:Uncharacterized protein n=1 Tax=Araneus ventricosus TaxID=182803 RepID=A0A4Y2VVJ2_ARAVE|nr:hypothetical protein AVEN_96304-1 [Araneus ventricosus]